MLENRSVASTAALPAIRFMPPSKLHNRIEEQAREIHDLRERLGLALKDLGCTQAELAAPPMENPRHQAYRKRQPADPALPAGTAWWSRPGKTVDAMRPAPGSRCAGIIDTRAPVLAVLMCGLKRDQAREYLDYVIEQQITHRAFVPLFVTDQASDLDLFRHEGYDVELFPNMIELRACPGAVDPEWFLRRRLDEIIECWSVARIIDLGSRPLISNDRAPEQARTKPLILFYKDYSRFNPYQHLLYNAMPGFEARGGTIEQAIEEAASRTVLFHLNWEEAIYRESRNRSEAMDMAESDIAQLDRFMNLGGKIIWTVHNETPHDNDCPAAFDRIGEAVAERASLIILHSEYAGKVIKSRLEIAEEKIIVVPHGNYRPVYKAVNDRKAAQKKLGFDKATECVFGFIGNVRPYKGVGSLLRAFDRLEAENCRLLIAGKQEPRLDLDELAPVRKEHIKIVNRIIDHADMPAFLGACDIVVLPYRKILTSGSLLLAFSLDRPVIVPDFESLRETTRDGEAALMYDPGDKDGLLQAMQRYLSLNRTERRRLELTASATARFCEWGWIGRSLAGRLNSII